MTRLYITSETRSAQNFGHSAASLVAEPEESGGYITVRVRLHEVYLTITLLIGLHNVLLRLRYHTFILRLYYVCTAFILCCCGGKG